MTRVLLVEPDAAARERLRAGLAQAGFSVEAHADLAADGLPAPHSFDVVAANAALPSGLDPIACTRPAPIVLLAANANVPDAVQTMRRGAADYLAQPTAQDVLVEALNRAVAGDARTHPPAWRLCGASLPMRQLFARIRAAAPLDAAVLIEGESGTGKELVARTLHDGRRGNAPMITLNCLATAAALVESELFGHARPGEGHAAGLVAAARGGTLLLKDVGELPPGAQARLADLLRGAALAQEARARRAPLRVVATTRRDIDHLARSGRFSAELLASLSGVRLTVPPLRARGDDIGELAQRFAARAAARLHRPPLRFSAATLAALAAYPWPGNVRELRGAVERAVLLCEGAEIDAAHLPIEVAVPAAAPSAAHVDNGVSLEGYFVRFVMEHQEHLTETELATRLGISRKSLWERRKRHGIPRRRTRQRAPSRDAP